MDKKNILITGATGFVGAHLLNRLIEQDDINNLYVISRNVEKNTLGNDHELIATTFEKYKLKFLRKNIGKIRVIYGNLIEPRIGIDSSLYEELSLKINVIYHVAADVNHLKSYENLEKVNVESAKEIANFSIYKNIKIINFISTMGAASKKSLSNKFLEDFPECNNNDENILMGYLKSKYEAEKILSCQNYKNNVNIFRLGYISGSSINGVGLYENNQFMLFIKSCIQLGFAPTIERLINFTPIDFTSEILCSKFFRNQSKYVMHLVNNREYITWLELIDFLNENGFKIKKIDLPSWQEFLKGAGRDNALYRMLLVYRRRDADNHIIRFGKNVDQYNIDNVAKFCEQENIIIPRIKYEYLKKIFDFLVEEKFLTREN